MSSCGRKYLSRVSTIFFIILVFVAANDVIGQYISVPGDFSSIQAAIDSASEGDSILVAPGIYNEALIINDKSLFLASWFFTTEDGSYISQTILDGVNGESVIVIDDDVALGSSSVIGFTLQNANNGVYVRDGKANITNCRVIYCIDGLEYKDGTSGICRDNLLELNIDDGIDLNRDVDILIENNIVRNNAGDGMEIRIEPYTGVLLNYIIRRNIVESNDCYGIQIIDYGTVSDRIFIIEENLIINNGEVGVGCISEPQGPEYEGVGIPERIYLFNNTFFGNLYGVTGGDSLVAVNNIFVNHEVLAMKNSNTGSIVYNNLFWNNTADFENCNVDIPTILFEDPLLDAQYQLTTTSPAIDRGVSSYTWYGELVLNRDPSSYNGSAPDLGALEYDANDTPLPVKLVSFGVVNFKNNALIKWTTESELHTIGFEIYRANKENGKYTVISDYQNNIDLEGRGNSSIRHEYQYLDTEIEPGKKYWYKIADTDYSNLKTFHGPIYFSIPEETKTPVAFKLYPVFPNPFNSSTTIKFEIPESPPGLTDITLLIYNNQGQIVKKLYRGEIAGGLYIISWDGTTETGNELSSGVYYAYLTTNSYTKSIKMILLR